MQQDRVRGVEDAVRGLRSAHAVDRLRREHDRGAVAAHHLDHPRRSFAVGDRGELVDDEQDLAAVGVAAGEVLLEVLDEEAPELARLLAVEQLVEQQIGAVDVLECEASVELAARGVEERAIALAAGVDVLVAHALDLLCFGPTGPEDE